MSESSSAHLAPVPSLGRAEADLALALARDGDDRAFARLVAPYRRELHAHCYRMLGSVHDAEDALQEALVRAWRGLARFEGRSSLRSWLYTVATRVCLDAAASRARRALPMDLGPASTQTVLDSTPRSDVAWLTPYPDAGATGGAMEPQARYDQREAVELAFVAALQHLPGNQRAALLLFDVLGFSAAEIAGMMDTSTASVNSALARARRVITERTSDRGDRATRPTADDARARRIAARFATALEHGDIDAFVALLTEDVTWSMPPAPHWYQGIDAVTEFAVEVPMTRCPSWRTRIIGANGQAAVACYVGQDTTSPHEAWSITVLTLRGDRIAAITSFLDSGQFALFHLPTSVP
ncbi:sigma-70 family RNA polymerase sigma factor [Occultella kanbiaonis]|uniref:sigma-70 family RNA polymerase sigma factor n=1 Tax=Occultella kanbiaonis TaxID=2675754 RepID=UPI001E4F38AC|nr:sigma-70 family RNA polymerase sigma factor [Occultella kanbiaonis]